MMFWTNVKVRVLTMKLLQVTSSLLSSISILYNRKTVK